MESIKLVESSISITSDSLRHLHPEHGVNRIQVRLCPERHGQTDREKNEHVSKGDI